MSSQVDHLYQPARWPTLPEQEATEKREAAACEFRREQEAMEKVSKGKDAACKAWEEAQRRQAEVGIEVGVLIEDLGREAELTAKKVRRVADLDIQLRKLILAVHEAEKARAELDGAVGVAARAAHGAAAHAKQEEIAAARHSMLLEIMRGRLEKLRHAAVEHRCRADQHDQTTRELRARIAAAEARKSELAEESTAMTKRWKKAVAHMDRVNTALAAAKTTRDQLRSKALGLKVAAQVSHKESQELAEVNVRLSSQLRSLERKKSDLMDSITAFKQTMDHEAGMVQHMLQEEASLVCQLKDAELEVARAEHDAKELHAERCRVDQECRNLQEKLNASLMQQAMAHRGGAAAAQELRALGEACLLERAVAENLAQAIERARQEAADEAAKAEELEYMLSQALEAVKTEVKRVGAAEGEHAKLLHDIESSLREVQAANRELQRLRGTAAGGDPSPVKVEVAKLQSELAAKEKATARLREEWAQLQCTFLQACERNAELARAERAQRELLETLQQRCAVLETM